MASFGAFTVLGYLARGFHDWVGRPFVSTTCTVFRLEELEELKPQIHTDVARHGGQADVVDRPEAGTQMHADKIGIKI